MGVLLDGFPYWGQLADPDPTTGAPDIDAQTDCGEECVSIWLAQQAKEYTDAADLRRELPGTRTDGRTTPADLVFLLHRHHVNAVWGKVAVAELQPICRKTIDLKMPVAILGNFISANILHWLLVMGYGNDSAVVMDPWSGTMRTLRWGRVRALATGDYVQGTQPSLLTGVE